MCDRAITGIFQGLVRQIGGVDAAAAVIEAHCGMGHKGTVSKMCAGQLGVTISAATALENALGQYPLTEFLSQRRVDGLAAPASLSSIAAQSALLSGQMQSSLMLALSDEGDGGTAITQAEAGQVQASVAAMIEVAQRMQDVMRVYYSGVMRDEP